MVVQPKAFSKCLEMGLQNHAEIVSKVAEVAGKEFSNEQVSGGMVIGSETGNALHILVCSSRLAGL